MTPDASVAEIKVSFRRLAKKFHPDRNHKPDAAVRFQELTEAFRILSDSAARAKYDHAENARQERAPPADVNPVACSLCGKVTAQPRYLVFRYVMSALVVTRRKTCQGVYCASCARRTALRATAISAFAGWWGIPWGPVCTIADIWRNAFGGIQPEGSTERLLWRNALVFTLHGNNELSYAIARNLRSSRDEEIAFKAARLMETLKARGVNTKSAHLKSAWSASPLDVAAHFALLLMMPGLLLATWLVL